MENLKDFFGIVVYSIEKDGCLNGLWTNTANKGEILNEIAKKNDGNYNCIDGNYIVTYIEHCNREVFSGKLKIIHNSDNSYRLEWEIDGVIKFLGEGFIIGNRLVVSYWECK